jgi:glutamine amidotransferase
MQLLASYGREHETSEGLGWIPGEVVMIEPDDPALKIPHMGWNTLHNTHPHALLQGIPTGAAGWNAYFVHSYHLKAEHPSHVLATTDYGQPITAIVGRDNIVGTQFHPEKSQKLGLAFIANFLRWQP